MIKILQIIKEQAKRILFATTDRVWKNSLFSHFLSKYFKFGIYLLLESFVNGKLSLKQFH